MSLSNFYIPIPFLNKVTDNTLRGISFLNKIRTLRRDCGLYQYLFALSHLTGLLIKRKESEHILTFGENDGEVFFEGLNNMKKIGFLEKGLDLLRMTGDLTHSRFKQGVKKYIVFHCNFFKSDRIGSEKKYYVLNEFTEKLNEGIRILGGPAKSVDFIILFLNYIDIKYTHSMKQNFIEGFGRTSSYSRANSRTRSEAMLRKQVEVFNKVFKTNLKVIRDTSKGIIKTGMRIKIENNILPFKFKSLFRGN